MVSLEERILARGHSNISGTHRSTLEVTIEETLTAEGDCIVGVCADKAARDLSAEIKAALKNPTTRATLILKAGRFEDVIRGRGDAGLSFQDQHCMIFRKSGYVCPRTVMVQADKAAANLSRELVSLLEHDQTRVLLTIEVEL